MDLRKKVIVALLALLGVLVISVGGYMWLGPGHVSFLDALYMAVITLAGVGYEEVISTRGSTVLRIFNMFIVVFGVMITVYVFSSVTAFLVEGQITDIFWRRKMLKKISQLADHFIVCGLGDTGRHAVEELQKTGTPYVVVEHNEENINKFRESHQRAADEMLYIVGDATDVALLEQLGIDKAKGLITTLASDKENLVITVLARQKNPKIRIIARCIDTKFAERILKAGANSTVSPNQIGGMRIASEALRPHVVGFLDLMLKEKSRTLRIEEIDVRENSPWAGKRLADLALKTRFNLLPLATKDTHHRHHPATGEPQAHDSRVGFVVNPADDFLLRAGTVVIVLGDVTEIHRARTEAAHAAAMAGSLS
ncbi:MAG TPA: potassium channel protein [Terriglobales bacterium]